jgi:tRNA/tmRNA/rRNA uracil-C5-methylase (TrmA/RlmC/RlmD family)
VTDLLELKIERAAHGGVFVARHEGMVIFVSGTLPGERILARVTDTSGKTFWRAETVRVLEPSSWRQESIWPEGAQAGAEFGHIELAHQRTLKAGILDEALSRMAGLEGNTRVEPLPGETNGLGYRTRVQLQIGSDGTAGIFGQRSHDLIPVTQLPLAVPAINDSGLAARKHIGAKKLSIAVDDDGNLQFSTGGKPQGAPELRQRAGGREFRLRGGFWQVHKGAANTLVDVVSGFASSLGISGDVLDLYSGAGLFAANLASGVSSVTAVESSGQSVRDGIRSSRDLANLSFVEADVLKFLRGNQRSFETVVMDPPRSGATGKVIAALQTTAARNLIYVACDPVALARDLKQLGDAGWELVELRAIDLFPHTHHFEVVVALTR